MGVLAEAIRKATGATVGPYHSALEAEGVVPNSNFLGFRPLLYRRNEAKEMASLCDISETSFTEYPSKTGFNFELIQGMSNYFSTSKTFKNNAMKISALSEVGSAALAMLQEPVFQGVNTSIDYSLDKYNSH